MYDQVEIIFRTIEYIEAHLRSEDNDYSDLQNRLDTLFFILFERLTGLFIIHRTIILSGGDLVKRLSC